MHKTWRKSHKAPPATPVEEKEYATLMSKIVGTHPLFNRGTSLIRKAFP